MEKRFVDPDEIQNEIITFYKSLMVTASVSTTAVSESILKQGPTLNQSQQMALYVEVTEMEAYDGLYSISDDKAPGVDGYNAMFFKKPCL